MRTARGVVKREEVGSNLIRVLKVKGPRCRLCYCKMDYDYSFDYGHYWFCQQCQVIGIMPVRKYDFQEFDRACCVCGVDAIDFVGKLFYLGKKLGLL